MSELIDRLQRMTVTVTSPDGTIVAETRGEHLVEFAFRGTNPLDTYDADALARQIATVLRATAQGRRDGTRKVFDAAGRKLRDTDGPHWDAARRRYRAALTDMKTNVRSPNGMIWIGIVGDRSDYRVKIHPKAISELCNREFLQELHKAHADAAAKFRQQRSQLKREHLPH